MPGPAPHYRPRFPDEFLTEARRLVAARTAAAHLRQRAQMVLILHQHPSISNAQLAARLDLHPNCVRRWRQRWAGGNLSLADAPGRGRRPTFSPSGQGRRRLHRL